jgi:hypothetical protein
VRSVTCTYEGYIIEDDCMEVLFSRLGRYVLYSSTVCIIAMNSP